MPNTQQLTVSTRVPVPRVEAWRIFTSSDCITKWNFASSDWHCPSADVDLRVGGVHRARMEARDGSVGFDFMGTYEEVDEPHVISLRLEDGRTSRTTFEDVGGWTLVTTTFDPDAEVPLEMQQQGWQAILNNYSACVADGAPSNR